MGKKNRYIYYLYDKNNKLIDKGLAKDLADKYGATSEDLFQAYDRGYLFKFKYKVKRIEKYPYIEPTEITALKLACELLSKKDKETGYDANMWYQTLIEFAKGEQNDTKRKK